jgi:ankyrin repeat protein
LVTEGKAEVDKATNKGSTPLFISAQEGNAEIVEFLVTEGKAEVDKADNDGCTSLLISAKKGFTEIVKFLVTEGKAEVDKTSNNGVAPLLIAAMLGKAEIVDVLLQHSDVPDQPMVRVDHALHNSPPRVTSYALNPTDTFSPLIPSPLPYCIFHRMEM